jgi:hypothetical protein
VCGRRPRSGKPPGHQHQRNGLIEPFIASSTDVQVSANRAFGALASYRFMLTPSSALEANYGITYQNKITFQQPNQLQVLTRTQEISGAYVRTFNYRKFNPVCRSRAGGIDLPAHPQLRHHVAWTPSSRPVGGMYGAGIAYEISPSFDIRAEYPRLGHQGADLRRYGSSHQQVVQHLQPGHRRGLSLLGCRFRASSLIAKGTGRKPVPFLLCINLTDSNQGSCARIPTLYRRASGSAPVP